MVSVVQTVDTSHEDMIHDAQMDYYGTRLATCSSDKTVKVFDVRNGTQTLVATLTGHEGPVWQVAFAHPMFGTLLASCSYDQKVIIWKEVDGKWDKVYVYDGHESSVNSLSWAPHEHGLMLACASSDGAVSVLSSTSDNRWAAQKIDNAHTIGCNAVSWEPAIKPGAIFPSEGKKIHTVKRMVTGGCDNLVKIWKFLENEEKWVEEEKLEAHSDWVRDVAWAPSVGLQGNAIASCSSDRRVIIWNLDEKEGKWVPKDLHTFDDVVWHVSWSLTGNILAVSDGGNRVSLWKLSVDGTWACISNIDKGQSTSPSLNNSTDNNPKQSEFNFEKLEVNKCLE